jgi:hypothetical protein
MARCLCFRENDPPTTAAHDCPKHGTCGECDGDGYVDVIDDATGGVVVGPMPCPYGCPPRIPEGQEALDV